MLRRLVRYFRDRRVRKERAAFLRYCGTSEAECSKFGFGPPFYIYVNWVESGRPT